MSGGMAAVQARIAQIQGQFTVPVARTATAGSSTDTKAFAQVLASSTAQLGGTGTSSAAAFAPASAFAASSVAAVPAGATDGSLGDRAVAAAKEHLGTPYLWGGSKPGGFDCSGLLQYAYKQVGIDIPRVSNDQKNAGRAVSAAEARPGDLVFFERGKIDHIGMYVGDGKWIHAPRTGDVVKIVDIDLSKATTIRRVTPEGPTAAPGAASPGSTFAAAAAGAGAGRESAYTGLFAAAGAKHGVSAALLTAVARAESAFNPSARSPAGAQGLMQFMPATARGLGIDPLDPAQAVDGAARLLKENLSRFGSTELALAAYNAGPGAVTKHGGIPPYKETQDYVNKIMRELRGGA